MSATDRQRVFLYISIGIEPAGRLVIELFNDKTPKTCENFRILCNGSHKGLSYVESPFHRVIDEFMIQGGDITKGDGTGGLSIYGNEFEDENLNWREMDAAGLVCMANRGRDTNSSQFFITLEPCPHLNGKHTIFGRVVSGQEVLDRVAKVPVNKDDRPVEPVLISRCGELERKANAAPSKPTHQARSSIDRGRKRGTASISPSRSRSISRLPVQPQTHKRRRRRSDDQRDETLRGRSRDRGSDSDSRDAASGRKIGVRPVESSGGPRYRQQRVRSRSPSRSRSDSRGSSAKLRRSRSRSVGGRHEERRRDHTGRWEDRGPPRRRSGSRERDSARFDGRRDDLGQHWRGGGSDDRRRQYWDRDRGGGAGGGHRDQQWNGGRVYRPRYAERRDEGRLGGTGAVGPESGIEFKGRGAMKYREPDRRGRLD